MPSQHVRFRQFFPAPPAEVFAYFADHERNGRIWAGRARRLQDGEDPTQPDGLGSVRELKGPGPAFEETIVVFDPPRRIEYEITRGSPFKNHRGVILFAEARAGTSVEYSIGFDPKIPGTGAVFARWLRFRWNRGLKRTTSDLSNGT
jgi:uncharacterized protein YndB with AHSA1/START domain